MNDSSKPVPVGSSGKLQNNIALPYQFSVGNVLQESWKRVKGTKATYLGACALYFLIYFALIGIGLLVAYLYTGTVSPDVPAVNLISSITKIITGLLTFPIPFGISLLAVHRSVNLPIKISEIFKSYSFYAKLFGVLIIIYVGAIVITLFTVFLVTFIAAMIGNSAPAFFNIFPILIGVLGGFAVFYYLFSLGAAPLLIMEKRFGIFQAIKTSFLAFKQHGLKIIATSICILLIYTLSIIPFGIGLIWTIPLLLNGMGVLYRIQFGVES